MSEIIEKYLEMAVSIFIYVTCAALTSTLLIFAKDPIIVQGSDKTFVESTGVQGSYESAIYGRDLLLMLLNTDIMSPYPKAIKINNSPVIKLDTSFTDSKMVKVSEIYSDSGSYKLSTMLDYKVTSKEFISNQPDSPYIQYVLKEVP